MCSFFKSLHQSTGWLIHLQTVPEPLGFPKDGSWQHCMCNLSAGSLPASLPGKTCSWSSLCLAPRVPRFMLRSGDFTADHRPPSNLNTSVVSTCTEQQRCYWSLLLDSCASGTLWSPKLSRLRSAWVWPEKPQKHPIQYTGFTLFFIFPSSLSFSHTMKSYQLIQKYQISTEVLKHPVQRRQTQPWQQKDIPLGVCWIPQSTSLQRRRSL